MAIIENTINATLRNAHKNKWARKLLNRLGLKVPDKTCTSLPFNRCIQDDGFIHIYTDGSYAYNKAQLGLGIVIPDRNDKVKFTFSRRIIPERSFDIGRFGAMKAEFMAATHALKNLPQGANIHIYTDHPLLRTVLRRYIGQRKMLWRSQTDNGHHPTVIEMVEDLRAALADKAKIQVTNLKDTESRRMAMAHRLAAKGSGAKAIKARRIENPVPTGENAFLMGDPRDNESEPLSFIDPMPIIDFKP